MPKIETAHFFGVSLSSVKRYTSIAREGGSLAPKKRPGRSPKIDENARKLLQADMKERPAGTIAQRYRFLKRITGTLISDSTIWQLLKRLGFSRKKDFGCNRKGRIAEDSLAGDDRREDEPKRLDDRLSDASPQY